MRIAILVKVVPDLEKLTFDPTLRAVERAGVPLFTNPFDQRAVAGAQSLRVPGGELTLVSMGPPGAEAPLRELLELGADRAVLVSDPALRASDGLVTARVLAAALRPLAPDLVLAGSFSTDSSTAQVPSQLAELLGFPYVGDARRIALPPGGPLEVTHDTEEGWARSEVSLPCVVTVGEKVAKPLKAPTSKGSSPCPKPLRTATLTELGLLPSDVGTPGSPTQVFEVKADAPERHPVVLGEGTLPTRARRAAEVVAQLLPRARHAPPPLQAAPSPREEDREVLVLVSGRLGGVEPRTLPLLAEVRRLPSQAWPTAVGFGPLDEASRRSLSRSGALRVLWDADGGASRSPEDLVRLLEAAMGRAPRAQAVFLRSDLGGREAAGRLSARRSLGLVADATELGVGPEGDLVYRKPSFGGGWKAGILSRSRPTIVTLRDGAFLEGVVPGAPPELLVEPVHAALVDPRVRTLARGVEREERFGDMARARVVVALGMGIGGPERIPAVVAAARPLGAAFAATRKVVDAGWVPAHLQLGLTGRSAAPDLLITVGASGRPNHLIGARRARVILGINSDATAPIFEHADVGVLGDWQEVLPPVVEELRKVL